MDGRRRSPVATGWDAAQVAAFTVGAHVAAEGRLPSWGFLFALLPLVLTVCWSAGARLLRVGEAAALLVVLQLVVHVLLELATAPAGPHPAGLEVAGVHLTGAMLVAHVLSGLAAAVVLSAGHRLVTTTTARLRWFTAPPYAAPEAPRTAVGTAPGPARSWFVLTVAPGRGPPALLRGA